MQFSEEQIIALAPDESSKKAGKDLANPSKWVSKGANKTALWGECQGSGSKPYQTQIDLVNLAFKCSCPSRKFPCKHGLGLLLLHARQPSSFTTTETPAWVSEWLSRRSEKEVKKNEKSDKPINEEAQAKRRQAREQKVAKGADELLLWIKDIVRNGILNIPEKSPAFWDGMTKRMVDTQAPGLAAIIREISSLNFYKEGWQSSFVDRLTRLYLLIQGYKNIASLNEKLQADIKALIGFTQSGDELKAKPGIKDEWLVLGKQVSQEEQLTAERNWLYGTHSKQAALVLQFIVNNQAPAFTITPGTCINAELIFYPSTMPLRAIIKQQSETKATARIEGYKNWEEVAMKETNYSKLNPFTNAYPFILEEMKPVRFDNLWWLQDKDKKMMKIDDRFANIWKLLAISGGEALSLAVTGKENNYLPLGAWHNNSYKLL